MKHIIILIIAFSLIACQSEAPTAIANIVMADRTDPNIPEPDAEIIKRFCSIENNLNSSVWLKFQNITNTDVNESYVLELEAFSSFGNKLQRNAEIRKFNTAIDTLVIHENNRSYTYHSSSIIVPLLDRLTELSKVDATVKNILLYSDISEFSDIFNVYDTKSRFELQDDPVSVVTAFTSQLTIPNLQGITLHIIYYPKTTEQNRLFRSMVEVYTEVFKDSGLEIRIGIDKSYTQ